MPYSVELTPNAVRDLGRLDASIAQRLRQALYNLENDPRPHGYRKMAGQKLQYRIRVGDYRIIYECHDDSRQVVVKTIRHRREAYR